MSEFRDPVDHVRTTRTHAGESMIDVANWPGYLIVVSGVVAIVGCIAALGTGHRGVAVTAAVTAVIGVTCGITWLVTEHLRIRRVERRWYKEHPEAPWRGRGS